MFLPLYWISRSRVVALAVANVAGYVDVGQEVHFHLDYTIAFAGSQRPPLTLKEKRPVRSHVRVPGYAGKQLADRREQAGVGGRIGAWGPPDWALVDVDYLVVEFQAMQIFVRCRLRCEP